MISFLHFCLLKPYHDYDEDKKDNINDDDDDDKKENRGCGPPVDARQDLSPYLHLKGEPYRWSR